MVVPPLLFIVSYSGACAFSVGPKPRDEIAGEAKQAERNEPSDRRFHFLTAEEKD
jgi:hypothetical protein